MLSSTVAAGAAATTCASPGRVAVVTGANKGIGYFIALQLGMSGLFQHVLLACRDTSRGQAAVQSIQSELQKNPKRVGDAQIWFSPLTLGDTESHKAFASKCEELCGGKIDVLVNNAAIAFKGSDPTPFAQQTKPTIDVNFRGTVDLTERLLPLLKKGQDARIVNVASMSGYLGQVNPELQKKFSDPTLTMETLHTLVNQFESNVQAGTHKANGWGNSNYGMSKLALIAATKIWARELAAFKIVVNCCCPGYCRTDMSSNSGTRDPADGARNAVIPATMENPPTGEFFSNYKPAKW